jgi:peptidoglycan/xylan/chitin deacetylase (PgdA/CDA1 family)
MILRMPNLTGGNKKRGCCIVIFGFISVLIIFCAGLVLREFPQKHDRWSRQIILRYDDFRLYKDSLETQEEEFIKFALTENIKLSIAVIPFDTRNEMSNDGVRPSKVQLLIDGLHKDLFEITLHGYQHKNNAVGWAPSEFGGVPLLTQETWLEMGKRKLEALTGAKVKAFVPPFNGWDQNTLKALGDKGFSILSAEAGDFPKTNDIKYFPYTATPKDLQYLLATNSIGQDRLIIVNIHPFDLKEDKNRIGLTELRKLLNEIRDDESKFELEFFENVVAKETGYTEQELLDFAKMLNHIRFWMNMPVSNWMIRTSCLSANRPYYSNSMLNLLKLLLGANLCVLGFLISQVFVEGIKRNIVNWIISIIMGLGIVLSIIIWKSLEYFEYGQVIAGKRYGFILLTIGILIGLILQMLSMRKVKLTSPQE